MTRQAARGHPAAHDESDAPERWEDLPGGSATNRARLDRDAFSQPSATSSFEERADFFVGNGFFKRMWVTAPSSTEAADGLGPLYNARSCQGCHLKDGRGHPPEGPDDSSVSMFLRLSIPPQSEADRAALATHRQAVIGEPTYGTQLQDLAIPGQLGEGRMAIRYAGVAGRACRRRDRPSAPADLRVVDPAYGPLHPETMLSPRVAQPMIGLGLLEAVPEADLLARADPDDADGDGISGRPNLVWSEVEGRVAHGPLRLEGRTGHDRRAGRRRDGWRHRHLQSAGDHPAGDCTPAQTDCLTPRPAPPRGSPTSRRPTEVMELVDYYSRNLAVPARRDPGDPQVLPASGCSTRPAAPAAIRPSTRPGATGRHRAARPADLALHRPAAARHGRRARRRPARGRWPTGASGARRRCGASA